MTLCFYLWRKTFHLLPLSMLVAVDLLQRYKMLFWFELKMPWKVMWLRHGFSRWAVGRYLDHKDSELSIDLYILIESHFDDVGRWWELAKVGKQATRGLYLVLVSFALPSASWLSWAEELCSTTCPLAWCASSVADFYEAK